MAWQPENVYNNGAVEETAIKIFFCFMEQFCPSVHLYSVSGYESKEVADGNQ